MKNLYKNISSLLLGGIILFTSCNTDLDINRDPDLLSPTQVPMSAELPAAMTGVAASAGSYYAIIGGFWSQFWTQSAVANQYKVIDDFTLLTGNSITNDAWSSMYDALTDIRNVKANAAAEENWNYFLIASTLEVYANQILVDYYGSIPYTEANNSAILNPVFDTAEDVYDQMVIDLTEALGKDLSLSPIANAPGTTDFIFGGDMTEWTKFANTLLLRVYMRQTEIRPSVAQAGISGLLTANTAFLDADAAISQFTDEDSRSNPLYETDRRQLNVATNLRASETMGSYLTANADPRLAHFYDGTTFQLQGDFDQGSGSASVVELAPETPFYFISLAESEFLQAEAEARYGSGANAKTHYDAGVTAAFDVWGEDASTLLGTTYAYPSSGTLDVNIEAIITQKWVASFPGNGFESFLERNRTNYPVTSAVAQSDPTYVAGQFAYPVEGKSAGEFAKRLEYPQEERQRNSNAPSTVIDITEAVWYDAN
jgi:hypothetical protein